MRARLYGSVVVLALVALVGALVVGSTQSRENEKKRDQATAEQALASALWPEGFTRVPNGDEMCEAEVPAICLTTDKPTKDAAAALATRLGVGGYAPTDVAGAPESYTLEGTLNRDDVDIVATVTARADAQPKKKANKPTFTGSNVVIDLAR